MAENQQEGQEGLKSGDIVYISPPPAVEIITTGVSLVDKSIVIELAHSNAKTTLIVRFGEEAINSLKSVIRKFEEFQRTKNAAQN